MTLKRDLLTKGYLPEGLPPMFVTESLGSSLTDKDAWLSDVKNETFRASPFNASKRGMTRRTFSFIHPTIAHDLSKFISDNERKIDAHFAQSNMSFSKPVHNILSDRAVSITSHVDLEGQRFSRLAHYRFIARTDISRFYHSIYTHSIPWALYGKQEVKKEKFAAKFDMGNRLDKIIRNGQDGQTIGIPVGPDVSRYIAEIVATSIDTEFVRRGGGGSSTVLRHVDDVWIGAHTQTEAEEALWRYRESIRSFELDINEAKTAIHAEDFCFSDAWPAEIISRIEFASEMGRPRAVERLRAALEYSFSQAVKHKDDGILKFTLRYLDKSEIINRHWEAIEPFLRRVVIHFGHTIDYVARIIVWRFLVHKDINHSEWSLIFQSIIHNHGRLGNDSEVCWAIYALLRLRENVSEQLFEEAIKNCSPIAVVGILACAEQGIISNEAFNLAYERLSSESARGVFWPLILEWKSRKWKNHSQISVDCQIMQELVEKEISILQVYRLTRVFKEFDEVNIDIGQIDFGNIRFAIEDGAGSYPEEIVSGDEVSADF